MGLNDSYSNTRSQILAMEPLPNVGKAYSIIHQEERQRLLHISSHQSPIESTALAVNNKFQSTNRLNQSQRNFGQGIQDIQERGRPYCDHCGKHGHVKARCYKIAGYLANWKTLNRSYVAAPVTIKPQQANDHFFSRKSGSIIIL
ncbi:hypothetical protein ACOSP7_029692 [Xanthoceras sorbifolium]